MEVHSFQLSLGISSRYSRPLHAESLCHLPTAPEQREVGTGSPFGRTGISDIAKIDPPLLRSAFHHSLRGSRGHESGAKRDIAPFGFQMRETEPHMCRFLFQIRLDEE